MKKPHPQSLSLPRRRMSVVTVDTLKSTPTFFCMTHHFHALETVQSLFVNLQIRRFYLRIQHGYHPGLYRLLHIWD
jgi:hypothetical protein